MLSLENCGLLETKDKDERYINTILKLVMGYWLTVLKLLYMCIYLKKKWLVGIGSQVSHYWRGKLQIREGD